MRKKRHLTIEEKRDWLAFVFRDESGEFSQADKFKAMAEDTRLAVLQAEQHAAEQAATPPPTPALQDILDFLPPPLPPSPS
ncbi:MAG: hypothetical protein IJB31_03255 [Akkermansia sp.]|nr:hypothetical protein [Akkermansia sp.]